jgi:signal transduction histidine kinase/sensor domain CHASE-containing protein
MPGRPISPARPRGAWRRLRLASKLSLVVAAIGVVSLTLGGLALDQRIRPAFAGLEQKAVQQQIDRARAFQQSALSVVESKAKDYAVWDDSYDYILDKNPAFVTTNITTSGLVNLDINALAYVRLDGELLKAAYVDIGSETQQPARAKAFGALAASKDVAAMARVRDRFSWFAVLNGRVLALGVAQVLRSDESGPPRGYVVMARELTDAEASSALQTAVKISGRTAPTSTLSTPQSWRVVLPLESPKGAVGTMRFELPRDTSKLGAETILSALMTGGLVMAGVLLSVILMMRLVVVLRLNAIDGHMRKVADSGELAPLPADSNADELASLGRTFNDMLAQLKELREQLEAQSFQLGQSESAASALHNVRNSLNPVTAIISQTLSEQAAASDQNIAQAIGELAAGEAPPERRERLGAFLKAAYDDIDRRAAARRQSFLIAKTSLAEALEILGAQSDTAQREIPLESFDILEVIEKNAALARFTPWGEVEIDLPKQGLFVRSNRLLASQVIGNLVTNAVESIIAADRRPGRLSITVAPADGSFARITLTDDGQGFAPETAAGLFDRGRSSKRGRSGGLGLHWCANTLRAMDGSLSLESDGPGKGARAIVMLPAAGTAAERAA